MSTRFPLLASLRAYWEGLREGGALPLRSQINPRGLENALENVFLIERVAPGNGRVRLAGAHLATLLGMDLRGMPISSLFEPSARPRLAEALEQVFSGPATLDLTLEAGRGQGRPALEGRMLLLPVRAEDGTPLALGALVTDGEVGPSPRRFVIARTLQERIGAHADPAAVPPQRAAIPEDAAPGMAEEQAPFKGPLSPKERPWLRLVRSDD